MAVLEIVLEGDPVLRQKARPVLKVNQSVKKLLDDMYETMKAVGGVGLAAPQVGISKRIIVVDAGEHGPGKVELINPEIIHSEGREKGVEGCLSIPGYIGDVERWKSIRVTGLNRQGHRIWIDAADYFARVLQHEIDHLDGVLYTDIATNVRKVEEEEEQPEEAAEAAEDSRA